MNKRGIFFTLIAILLVSVILFAFMIRISGRADTQIDRANLRVNTLSEYTKSFSEEYAATAIQVSSNRALKAILTIIETDKAYFGNSESFFKTATWENKDIMSNPVPEMTGPNGEDYTLVGTLRELVDISKDAGINLTIYVGDVNVMDDAVKSVVNPVSISQSEGTGPWYVNVSISNVDVIISDFADFNTNYRLNDLVLSSLVSIGDFRDPLWLINKDMNVSVRQINTATSDGTITLDEFIAHIEEHTFFHFADAPSFLSRLKGDLDTASECCGIMSVIDSNIVDYNPSHYPLADYMFWNDPKTVAPSCEVANLQTQYSGLYLSYSIMVGGTEQLESYNGGEDEDPLVKGFCIDWYV